MSDLQSLARQKALAAMEQRVRDLPAAIQALHRKLAAQGGLRSGAMLKQVLSLCQEALKAQGVTLTTEYRWAITQALLASQSWIQRLIIEASESIDPLYKVCIEHVKKAVEMAGIARVEEQLLVDLEQTRARVANDIEASLRSAFAEKRRGLVRAFPSFVGRLVSKLFGGGHS